MHKLNSFWRRLKNSSYKIRIQEVRTRTTRCKIKTRIKIKFSNRIKKNIQRYHHLRFRLAKKSLNHLHNSSNSSHNHYWIADSTAMAITSLSFYHRKISLPNNFNNKEKKIKYNFLIGVLNPGKLRLKRRINDYLSYFYYYYC